MAAMGWVHCQQSPELCPSVSFGRTPVVALSYFYGSEFSGYQRQLKAVFHRLDGIKVESASSSPRGRIELMGLETLAAHMTFPTNHGTTPNCYESS